MVRVRCGYCNHEAPMAQFVRLTCSGPMRPGEYQCPKCHGAWRLVKQDPEILPDGRVMPKRLKIVAMQSRL